MIDIPLNKALVAVEVDTHVSCVECIFGEGNCNLACGPSDREDCKTVIFKLVDLPGGIKNDI
jgi:hypothetical protein